MNLIPNETHDTPKNSIPMKAVNVSDKNAVRCILASFSGNVGKS